MIDKAHEICRKIYIEFDRVLFNHLAKENEEIRDYVERTILDGYRPWNYMRRGFEHDK